jgi:hypothetical protein
MEIRRNSLIFATAFTGLLGGAMARLNAAPAFGSSLSTGPHADRSAATH